MRTFIGFAMGVSPRMRYAFLSHDLSRTPFWFQP